MPYHIRKQPSLTSLQRNPPIPSISFDTNNLGQWSADRFRRELVRKIRTVLKENWTEDVSNK